MHDDIVLCNIWYESDDVDDHDGVGFADKYSHLRIDM